MSKLSLKSSVTRRWSAAIPPDLDERLAQAEYHAAAEPATSDESTVISSEIKATIAVAVEEAKASSEPAAARARDPEKKRDPRGLQSEFLIANLNRPVTVFLINGIKLVGRLRQFDQFTVMLEGLDGITSLTFKHTISTIVPAGRTNSPA